MMKINNNVSSFPSIPKLNGRKDPDSRQTNTDKPRNAS